MLGPEDQRGCFPLLEAASLAQETREVSDGAGSLVVGIQPLVKEAITLGHNTVCLATPCRLWECSPSDLFTWHCDSEDPRPKPGKKLQGHRSGEGAASLEQLSIPINPPFSPAIRRELAADNGTCSRPPCSEGSRLGEAWQGESS